VLPQHSDSFPISRFDFMYPRFSITETFPNLDYIIVGSGVGGLSTAVFLSKAGKKVLVLERHYVPGGFSHTFKRRDGFVWDVGVHYVGNMHEDQSFLRKIFNYLTDNQVKWQFMGDIYDEINIGKEKYSFPAGKEKLVQKLYTYFPAEKNVIDSYFVQIAQAAKYSSLFFLQKSFPCILQYTLGALFRRWFNRYALRTTYEVLRAITPNEKLISVLCAQCGNYGLPPRKSSFAAHALIVTHFIDGGYYPVGGADQIYKGMINVLEKHGGAVRIRANVDDIVTENGKVRGVTVDGKFIPCKNVISNAGVQNTFGTLMKKSYGEEWSAKLANVKPSTSHLCLYVGLDLSDEALKLPRNNVWFYDNHDFDGIIEKHIHDPDAPLKFAYISFPSAKDPAWKEKHPSTATIQAVGVANYDWFKAYENETWMKRGDAYEKMKTAFKDKMLAKLYELFPQIEGHVVCTEVSTPLSTKHFTNYQHGEIYGLEHTPERFGLKALLPKSSVKGLFLVGQDIVTVGVGGALASGLLCATAILKYKIASHFKAIAKGGRD
jgi:all-trans-retinol 13,14-reductase